MVNFIHQKRRERLVEVLCSDAYSQGTGCLRSEDNDFCCMGVAEDLRGAKWIEGPDQYTILDMDSDGESWHEGGVLTREGMDYYGFKTDNPYVQMPDGTWERLSNLNDNLKLSFNQIADIIKAQAPNWDGTK